MRWMYEVHSATCGIKVACRFRSLKEVRAHMRFHDNVTFTEVRRMELRNGWDVNDGIFEVMPLKRTKSGRMVLQ